MSDRGQRGRTGDTGRTGDQGRTGERGEPGKGVGERGPVGEAGEIGKTGPQGPQGIPSKVTLSRRLAVVAALCLAMAGGAGAALVAIWVYPQINSNREAIQTGIDVAVRQCESDHKFRIQYKVRGIAEKKLLALFLDIAQQNIEQGGPDQALNQDFIEEFRPLLRRIHILPPPDCDQLRARLEASL